MRQENTSADAGVLETELGVWLNARMFAKHSDNRWFLSITLVVQKWRQEDQEPKLSFQLHRDFETILGY